MFENKSGIEKILDFPRKMRFCVKKSENEKIC